MKIATARKPKKEETPVEIYLVSGTGKALSV
jgi:hypothetical protein